MMGQKSVPPFCSVNKMKQGFRRQISFSFRLFLLESDIKLIKKVG